MGLIRRCEDPRRADYPRYGGRGIRVCQRWRESFEAFLADMGSRPTRRHSLDRIDVNGNYEPGNCRWATGSTQAKNKRNYHPPVEKSCVICGARFMVPASATARRLCCSMHCRGVLGSRARRRVNGAFA
jgi:hypothetical protein